jgi:hypothetical protein
MVQPSGRTTGREREIKTATPREAVFQRKLIKLLRAIPNSWWTVKEAKSLRGLPDIFGCINGTFIALECKRSLAESRHNTGRTVLQKKILNDISNVGAYSSFIYPENMEEVLEELREMSKE